MCLKSPHYPVNAGLIAPYVHDSVELARATREIAKFARILGRFISSPDPDILSRRGRKARGARSAETLLKIAVNSGSEVTIRHTEANGEVFEAHVTPPEAKRILDEAENRRAA